MVKEVELALVKRQLNEAKEVIAELQTDNVKLRDRIINIEAQRQLEYAEMQNTVGLQKTLKETIIREREAAGRDEHTKLQNELKRMADLIKENEALKKHNDSLKDDIENKNQELLTYKATDVGGKAGRSLQSELGLLRDKIRKLTADLNQQSNDLNNALAENALLRQMSKVPDNFGEEIESYKANQQQNAIYYKRKNEYMEKEMRDLQEDNVRLRADLRRHAAFYAKVDDKANGLRPDQQRFLDDVIINLRDDKLELPLTDKSKELQEQVIKLQAIVATYENIMGNQGGVDGQKPNTIDQNQFNTIMTAIRDQKKDMENIFTSMRGQQPGSLGGTMERPVNSMRDSMREKPQDSEMINTINNVNRPPRPMAGIFGDWTEANEGMSYKFNTKLQLKTYDEELAGMDMDRAKYYIAALQLHNMESLELLHQRENEYKLVTNELEEVRNALRKALLVEDELFARHHAEMAKFGQQTNAIARENTDLKTINMELSHKVDLFEKTLSAIQTKNPNTVEGRLAEMTKTSAIAETNIIKLARKYDSLEAEHNDTIKAWKVVDIDQNQREYQTVEKMNKLLEWRADATEKIKILLQRVRTSVPIEEHNTLKSQFELERQKYASLKSNENVLVQQNAEMKGFEREKAEEVDKTAKLEGEIAGLEAEFGVLHMRLSALDPIYNRHAQIFKRIAEVLKNNNLSPLQFFQAIDTDKSGTLSSVEFYKALEQMGIVMTRDESDQFFTFMDLDNSGSIDYQEFNRKLRRLGVIIRSKEEELVNRLWNGIVKSGLTLEKAYEVFDKKGQNNLSFNDFNLAIRDIGLDVDPRTASEFFKMADVSGNGSISCAEFIHIFKRYNKVSQVAMLGTDSTLDWKLEMMARLDKICRDKNIELETVFRDIDGDGDGRVTLPEFSRLFLKMGIRIEKAEFSNLFNAIDNNHSGAITFPEFLEFVNNAKKESDKLNRMKMFNQKMQANALTNESMIMDGDPMTGYNDPNTRYQLKIAHIEAKEKSSKRQMGEFMRKITRLEEESSSKQTSIKGLEDNLLKIQQELIKEKERTSRLDKICINSLSKEKGQVMRAENENLRLENTQQRAALDTFRNLHEAAVREAKTLRVAVGRNDDENLHLRKEIRELQSDSDETALIGKLFNQVLTEKWTEAAFNKRFDQALDDLRKAQIIASNLEVKLRKKEDELFAIENGGVEKANQLERQLFEARMSILPMVSLGKLEELNLCLKRLANQKLELEVENKRLRTEGYENQIRLDNYRLREKNLEDLEMILKNRYPDELSAKIIELSEKLSSYKLNELKAQREVALIKEREEYFMRVNKTQTGQIQNLEEQVANNETKFNERENFWRARYNDQVKLLTKNSEKTLTSNASDQDVRNMMRAGIDKIASQDEKQMGFSPTKKSSVGLGLGNSTLDFDNQILRDKIKFLEDDNKYKDMKIEKLEKDLSTHQVGVNYKTDGVDTLVINDLESKTRDIAQAAQQTVMTLQDMLDEKSKQLAEREKKIDDLRQEIADKARTMARLELEVESLRRENAVGEHNRMNVEQYAVLRTMQKLGNMDQKELERVLATYENKLRLLAEELTEAERVNRELMQNLRNTRGENSHMHNAKTLDANISELSKLKHDNASMTELYKKKCLEVKRLNQVLTKYSEDLEKQKEQMSKVKGEETAKIQVVRNETGHYEEKIGVLTAKFTSLNEQLKEDKKQTQELKANEIRYREKISELNEQSNKLSAMNIKLKDENQKLQAKKLVEPSPSQASGPGSKPAAIRRPSSAVKQQGLPQLPTSGAGTPSKIIGVQPVFGVSPEELKTLKEENRNLIDENNLLKQRLSTTLAAKDFLDEDGCLAAKGSMAFKSREHLCEALRKYLQFLGPSTNLFNILKKADPKRTGFLPQDVLLNELKNIGIRFTDADRAMLPEYLPRNSAGQFDYKSIYYLVRGDLKDFSGSASFDAPPGTAGMFSALGTGGVQPKIAKKEKEDNNMHTAVLDRNVDLLKRKLLEKDKEVADLTKQLKTWKQTALNFENELKDKNNSGRNAGYGLNSTLEARLGRKGESLKQIQDLEEQVKTVKKELKYEVERREQTIKEINDDLTRKNYELTLSQSEAVNLRLQLDRVLSGKLQRDQLFEEKEKEKDLQVASLMARLEKSRKAEEDLRQKLRVIERENIDLKHIKEGIDTRLESLNREIRDLKDKKKVD